MKHNWRGLALFALLGILCAGSPRADMEAIDPSFDIEKTLPGVPRVTKMGDVGVFESYRYVAAGANRTARIYVPLTYDPDRPIGIMFGFHGYKNEKSDHPTLSDMRNIEPLADDQYFITVALATRYRPEIDGWIHGWNHHQNGMENVDARAVFELVESLKRHYTIDENRIYGSGHSNGAGFLGTVGHNLPHLFAAMWAKDPVCGEYQPAFNNTYATIGYGGVFDRFSTAQTIRGMNQNISDAPIEGDFYVFGIDHQPNTPLDDNVDPPLDFQQKALEFFQEHPRHYQYYGFEPAVTGTIFSDKFDDGEKRLSSDRWRVETFDREGILGDQAGYALRPIDGQLVNIPFVAPPVESESQRTGSAGFTILGVTIGQSEAENRVPAEKPKRTELELLPDGSIRQTVVYKSGDTTKVFPPAPELKQTPLGGLSHTLFYTEKAIDFSTEVVVNDFGTGSRVMPLWLADTRGRVHALVLQQDQYRWETYPTHRHFRQGLVATTRRPGNAVDDYESPDPILAAQGPIELQPGYRYKATLERRGGEFRWVLKEIYSDMVVAQEAFSLREDDSYQFGMGVTGAGVQVAFDNVSVLWP